MTGTPEPYGSVHASSTPIPPHSPVPSGGAAKLRCPARPRWAGPDKSVAQQPRVLVLSGTIKFGTRAAECAWCGVTSLLRTFR